MQIYLAADHRGFQLKEHIKQTFPNFIDVGAFIYDSDDDYVNYAALACQTLKSEDRAILLCGSGHGMDIAANRFPHVRAILGFNPDVVKQGRAHEDANVLIIPADWIKPETVNQLIDAFLSTPFSKEERHLRRLNKLKSLGTNH